MGCMADAPDVHTLLRILSEGTMTLQGELILGSNFTFLVTVSHQEQNTLAVYKPQRGEQPLWDFPPGSLAFREVAAFEVSQALGWALVPPTVYRHEGPLGAGSLQQFIEHDPAYHYFNFTPEDRQRLRPVALFDWIVNNADRKGGHILFDRQHHLWLIDHGICFHEEDKLRTVVWDFAGEPIPEVYLEDIACLAAALEDESSPLSLRLGMLLSPAEVRATLRRARYLLKMRRFPRPPAHRRYYPWPPV